MRWLFRSTGAGILLLLTACGSSGVPTNSVAQSVAGQAEVQPAGASAVTQATRPSLPSLPAVSTNDAQQAAMRDPEQVIRLLSEAIKAGNESNVEPLFTDGTRQKLAFAAGSVAAFFGQQAQASGKLVDYTITNKHIVYDSDAVVAFDVDWKRERRTDQGKVLLTQTDGLWRIIGLDDRTGPSLTEVTPSAEQKAALQDPQQVVRIFADELKGEQYGSVEPLFTYLARSTYGGPGGTEAHFRANADKLGKLVAYEVHGSQAMPNDMLQIDVTFTYAVTPLESKVILKKTPQGWKISQIGKRKE